jgi:hypothetical protein
MTLKKLQLSILTLTAFLFVTICASAATIKLKITYNGAAAQGHTVYILVGGTSLGSGITDNSGEVDINVSSIPSKSLELKGEKRCDNSEKKWSLSGWCNLDDNNYCHVKMEEPLNEMVEEMGGMMSANMLAAGWGLTCSESSSASTPAKKDAEKQSSEPEESSSEVAEESMPNMTPQEVAAQRKAQSEQKIAAIDAKIARKESKFEKNREDMGMDEILMHGLEIEELQTKKEIEQIELEEQTLKTTKLMLNKAERADFKDRKKAKEDRLDEINAEMKDIKKGNGSNGQLERTEPEEAVAEEPETISEEEKELEPEAPKKVEKGIVAPVNYAAMTDMELTTEKAKLRGESGKIKTGLKLRSKKMSDNEVAEKELRIDQISKEVDLIQLEQDSRKGK